MKLYQIKNHKNIEREKSMEKNSVLWVQNHLRTPALDKFFVTITKSGNSGIIWFLISFLLLSKKKTRKAGVLSLCSIAFSFLVCNYILKLLFKRTRPYDIEKNIKLLIPKEKDHSFPSGHSSSSFAAATAIFLGLEKKDKKTIGSLCLTLAALIAFSRLYVGVHYPSDIIGGSLNGIVCAKSVYKFSKIIENVRNDRKD